MESQIARSSNGYRYLREIQKSEQILFDVQKQPLQYYPTYDPKMGSKSIENHENGANQPIIPLVIEKEADLESEKGKYIQLEIKTRAGRDFPTSYKKYIRRFEEGSPYEFITLIHDLKEVFAQNRTNSGDSRDSVIQNLLRGESLDTYRASLEDLRQDQNNAGNLLNCTPEFVKKAMQEVAKTVFPFRSLDKQKAWMEREMRKPKELSVRKLASAITRLNNELEYYPNGSANSKFSPQKVVQLIEWSLPASWKHEFEKKGFIPSLSNKTKLIQEVEIIERQVLARNYNNNNKNKNKNKNDDLSKSDKRKDKGNQKKGKGKRKKDFDCNHCGPNNTHNSDKCYHLHPELRPKGKKQRTNEVNLIEKDNKTNEIQKLKSIINSLNKRLKGGSVHEDEPIPKKARFNQANLEVLQEENAYQKKIAQSRDGEESSSSESTLTDNSK